MQSTSQTNLDRQNTIPSIRPEVVDFFQSEVNPKYNSRADSSYS